MNKSDLQFLHSNLIMERFLGEDPLNKFAQESDGGVFSTIQREVSKLLAEGKEHPVTSILEFIGPGLLFMFGFKKISVAMALAEALGFNFSHFYASIKAKLKPILEAMASGEHKDSSEVESIVQESAEEAMQEQPDADKLQDIVMKSDASLNNMFFIYKVAQSYRKDPAVMQAIQKILTTGTGNKMRRGILGFVIRVFSWLITAVVIAAGFKIAGMGVSKILGIKKNKQEDTTTSDSNSDEKDMSAKDEISQVKLHLNPNASPEFSTTAYNDKNHVWLLTMNIKDIHNNLIKWAQELYPQLTDKSAFDASSKFNNTLRMFATRNKDVGSMDIVAVPEEFHSIKEIVSSFAADVALHIANSTEGSGSRYAQRKL